MTHKVEHWVRVVIMGVQLRNCGPDSSSGLVKKLVLQSGSHMGNGCPVFLSKMWPAGEKGY